MSNYHIVSLKREMESKYLIPHSKITKLEIEKRNVLIHFLNGNNDEDFEILESVEWNGITLIADLIESKKQSS